jgi:hypothetical protein
MEADTILMILMLAVAKAGAGPGSGTHPLNPSMESSGGFLPPAQV